MTEQIRNFCIISHIDHGKSTLADRFLEITKTVPSRKMREQYLDALELERERGITIKMAPVRMLWHPDRGTTRTGTRNDAEGKLLYEDLTYKIRGAAFKVRKKIGLGHKEIIYQKALTEEFRNAGIAFEKEKIIDVVYNDRKIGTYQPDFVVDNKIIVELKALPSFGRAEEEQLWSYLKGSSYKIALLINFGSRELEIKRIVYDSARFPREPALVPRHSAEVEEYILNLIDTPGHSDFSYEVSRALKAVEGVILLVDATQGIQAQTLANLESARKEGLKIIGVLNKIDLQPSGIEELTGELAHLLKVQPTDIHRISAKTGEGVGELLDAVIRLVPSPKSVPESAALIFSSLYDDHKGIIAFVRVFGGEFKRDKTTRLQSVKRDFKVKEVGYFTPEFSPIEALYKGEIGYIATGIKEPNEIRIGDTIGDKVLTGFQLPQPVVFVAVYPVETDDYENLKIALQKLKLRDASLDFTPDSSPVLGRGFKCGFLGRLHFEITVQRLEREFNLEVVTSFPSVAYRVLTKDKEISIGNPKDFPNEYQKAWEPFVEVKILTPQRFLGAVLELKNIFRFGEIKTEVFDNQIRLIAELPLADLISDFDDRLKSVSQGFASFSYDFLGFKEAKVKRLDILVAGEVVPGLSRIIPESYLEGEGRKMAERLKKLLPRQQFAQAVQATVGGKIIARETIPAMKKNVTGHLYGGDRTRKMKLWKKQKKGKKKLEERGRVMISAEVFRELLKK